MGGGASKVEAVGDKVGLIDVGPSNDKLIQLMSQLYQQLLTATNPINFQEALKGADAGTCNGMLVLLEPTIAKEFERLAIEDPGSSSKEVVQAVFKGYDTIEDFSSTTLSKTLCRQITLFFLRLIILTGVSMISIRPNKLMTGLLGTMGSDLISKTKEFDGIAKLVLEETTPAGPPAIKEAGKDDKKPEGDSVRPDEKPPVKKALFKPLETVAADSKLKSILTSVFTTTSDSSIIKMKTIDYYTIVFGGKEYVLDTKNFVFYTNEKDLTKKVGVVSLSTSLQDPLPKVGGGHVYNMKGGVLEVDAIMRKKSESEGKKAEGVDYFIFNRTYGDCKKEAPRRLSCMPSAKSYRITTASTALEVVRDIVEVYSKIFDGSVSSKELIAKEGATLEGVSGTGTGETVYSELMLKNKKTYDRLKQLSEGSDAMKIEEGTCLAVYRAYTIASGLAMYDGKKELLTYICHDKWATKETVLTKLPMFAMLEQLYNDRLGNEMEPETREKYNAFISNLLSRGTVEQVDSSKTEQTFSNLKFKNMMKENSLCKNSSSGFDKITDASIIEDILGEYTVMSNALVKLIDGIAKGMDKIIDLQLFLKENRVKLRTIFVTEKRGALYALNHITTEIRSMLEDHILTIEESYAKAAAVITKNSLASLLVDFKKDTDKDGLETILQ